MECEVYCAEISFTKLMALLLPDATYTPLPKFPAVTRDLSFVCDETITVAQAEQTIAGAAGKLLRSVKLFDIYRGANLGEGKKSLAFSLELRADDRTLTDADTEPVIRKVLEALSSECGAVLR
jgi:phenylalanyl-tRNA synthetase beta chain